MDKNLKIFFLILISIFIVIQLFIVKALYDITEQMENISQVLPSLIEP